MSCCLPGNCLYLLAHFPRLSALFDGGMVLFVMGTVNMSIPSAERSILTNFLGAISRLLPALDGVHIPWSIESELQCLNSCPRRLSLATRKLCWHHTMKDKFPI